MGFVELVREKLANGETAVGVLVASEVVRMGVGRFGTELSLANTDGLKLAVAEDEVGRIGLLGENVAFVGEKPGGITGLSDPRSKPVLVLNSTISMSSRSAPVCESLDLNQA